jgi:Zn-dependent M28 family amino/carboxypeptidase
MHRRLESANVVGVIQGSDPVLRDEYVILTAHLDGKGFKPTDEENDDEIYNGAMDNATGVAALLEVARLLSEAPPKRSIVVIALTAEEKGLIGSDYFARNPTMPGESIVATVNLDMPILTYEFTDVIAFGAERSTLYDAVFQATQRHGLTLSPDPDPDQGIFTRSDHYSFVKQGVPAVFLDLGFANGGESAQAEFLEMHYHQPSDEFRHVNLEALRRFTAVKSDIARNIANMPERPVWKDGDFFGTTFNGPME